jgi:hypothetical protein
MYDFQPIGNLLCFVVDRTSGAFMWFSDRQSWWTVEAAQQRFGPAGRRAVRTQVKH